MDPRLAQGFRAALRGTALLLTAACGPAPELFAPLPELSPGASAVLVEDPGAGLRRLHAFEAGGPTPRVRFDPEGGGSVRLAVLAGELGRLGLPPGTWGPIEGPSRRLGELGLEASLVLSVEAELAEFREDPSQRAALESLLVPDERSCARLQVRQGDISDHSARVVALSDVGGGQVIILDDEGRLLLEADRGRIELQTEGSGYLFPRAMGFDAVRRRLWISGGYSAGLASAEVPLGEFQSLRFESDPAAPQGYVQDFDLYSPGASAASLLVVLEGAPDGSARLRFRAEDQPERVVDLGALDLYRLQVRAAGAARAYLYSDTRLFEVDAERGLQALSLPGTHAIHSARYSERLGLLIGLSSGAILRARAGGLEPLLEVGGWWVLDVVPFERGFAYLLANGVVGQFIEGEGRCAETPVLGTLIHGRLVPMPNRWLVTGGLPGSGEGTRIALLGRD